MIDILTYLLFPITERMQLDEIVEEENKLESYKTDFNRSISLSYILRRRLQNLHDHLDKWMN
jgi:hypothetical protein